VLASRHRRRASSPTIKARTPSTSAPRYHLRFQIIPGPGVVSDARGLARFCRQHGIEEVVLFFAGEEWNNGLLSAREETLWFQTVRRARRVLEQAGLAVSLNPWMTVLHCARGRRFPPGRRFQPTVSPTGEVSRACASFADPAWQRYYYRLMRRFATLGFRVIWIEDDFRYHNHAPLTWGGGFEPAMLARFAAKVGRAAVSRRALLRALLRPGPPHPWRALWMETWRETHLEVARGIVAAVRAGSRGRTQVGLMSSGPAIHSTEGRRWDQLFAVLSGAGRPAHRPHFASYGEVPGACLDQAIMMLDLQRTLRPPDCEVAPEIENFPYTRWTKSDTQTWAQMALTQFFGADALLLNLFPFVGNPVGAEPGIGELLDRSRPALAWIAARFPKTLTTRGVGLPWKQDTQEHVRTTTGRSLYELDASSFGPGHLLLPYGIPATATPQAVNGIFGSLAWAFGDDELRRLLRGGLLLDADSAAILEQRGFGPAIGVSVAGCAQREEGRYAVEEVVSPRTGVRPGLFLSVNLHDRMGRLRPRSGAEVWTTILTPERTRFGAGLVAYRNIHGGRVVTCAVPNPAQMTRSYHRQALWHRVVDFLAGGRFAGVKVAGAPHAMPIHFQAGPRHTVVVLNGSPDPAAPLIHVGRLGRPAATWLLAPLSVPRPVQLRLLGRALQAREPIPYHGFLVLAWE